MIDWQIKPIKEYQTEWTSVDKPALGKIFDNMFYWINDSIEGRYQELDLQREKMLAENPNLNIKDNTDGFDLEVERLNAIQQRGSKGFQVIDINPGYLDPLDYTLSLPFEFLFDGTNFLPDADVNFTKNFRSVNIPIAGNFLKIEFIAENNAFGNIPNTAHPIKPYAQTKYQNIISSTWGEQDLTTDSNGNTLAIQDFDNFSRTKVYVDFGPSTGKPHLVGSNGKIFKTYFSEVNITLNIGAPKIRITIGTNSEVYEASNVSAINAKLSMAGSGRLFGDMDSVFSPFCITENDRPGASTALTPGGVDLAASSVVSSFEYNIIRNAFKASTGAPNLAQQSPGYSVVFINRIYFNCSSITSSLGYIHPYLYLSNNAGGLGQPSFQAKTVHNFKLIVQNPNVAGYVFEPTEPIRVVIPANWALKLRVYFYTVTAADTFNYSYAIDGYSFGEIIKETFGGFNVDCYTTKYITDATFLSDFNRTNNL